MAKSVELRRHTDNDGDVLSGEGVAAALDIGRRLAHDYGVIVSTGAQRATQTAACFLAGKGRRVARGVVVDVRFRSEVEDRWKEAYRRGGGGDLHSFERADPELVTEESRRFGAALRDLFDALGEGERAMVVGHSPMLEAAIYGVAGEVVAPLGKGEAVVVVRDGAGYLVEPVEP